MRKTLNALICVLVIGSVAQAQFPFTPVAQAPAAQQQPPAAAVPEVVAPATPLETLMASLKEVMDLYKEARKAHEEAVVAQSEAQSAANAAEEAVKAAPAADKAAAREAVKIAESKVDEAKKLTVERKKALTAAERKLDKLLEETQKKLVGLFGKEAADKILGSYLPLIFRPSWLTGNTLPGQARRLFQQVPGLYSLPENLIAAANQFNWRKVHYGTETYFLGRLGPWFVASTPVGGSGVGVETAVPPTAWFMASDGMGGLSGNIQPIIPVYDGISWQYVPQNAGVMLLGPSGIQITGVGIRE